jgi:hypothetical protein
MVKEGHYDASLHTQIGESKATLTLEKGNISGRTDRGATLEGTYYFDKVRGVVKFTMTSHMPANFRSVTGLVTGDEGRSVVFEGESTPAQIQSRFSLGFAGRAIDVALSYRGPLTEPEPQ